MLHVRDTHHVNYRGNINRHDFVGAWRVEDRVLRGHAHIGKKNIPGHIIY